MLYICAIYIGGLNNMFICRHVFRQTSTFFLLNEGETSEMAN